MHPLTLLKLLSLINHKENMEFVDKHRLLLWHMTKNKFCYQEWTVLHSLHAQLLCEAQNIYSPVNIFRKFLLPSLLRNKQPTSKYFKFRVGKNICTSLLRTICRYIKEKIVISVSSSSGLLDHYPFIAHACYVCGQQVEVWTANSRR